MSQGDRLVYGRCSYTAQTAWIQNATVRDNILMGRAYDAALYGAVIDACALQSDFDLLAAGVCREPISRLNLSSRDWLSIMTARERYIKRSG